jgi:hypothetical protein
VTCTFNGTLAPNTATSFALRVMVITIQCVVVNVATLTAQGDTDSRNNAARDTTQIGNCTPVTGQSLPGDPIPPGSVLIFPVYTSNPLNPSRENTRICITNTDALNPTFAHLFFVDGNTCSVTDTFICLTQSQTACFLASDIDPGVMGYIVAVAVNIQGCPINNNNLIGSESVKFGSGHFGVLNAESYRALPGLVPCAPGSNLGQINLNGVEYERPGRTLAASSILSPRDDNSTLLVLVRTGGNLATTAGTLGNIFGLLYDDTENAFSFTFESRACQIKQVLSDNFPRTGPRFSQVIPAGRTGWMKVFAQAEFGLTGALFNFNPNATAVSGAFNGGRSLHKLTLGSDTFTVPIFPPGC